MERLTKREGGHAYFPQCFEEPCCGGGCKRREQCEFILRVCERLCDFEDKLESGTIQEIKHARWELANDRGFFRRATISWCCSECGAESVMNGKEARCTACGAIMDAGKRREMREK